MSVKLIQAILCELTHRCPLQCPYCYNPVDLTGKSKELPVDIWRSVIEQASQLKVQQIHFSGGEPCLYPGLEALIALAGTHQLYTNLVTSGMTLSRQDYIDYAKQGLKHVQISFQGPSSVYDSQLSRAKGAFDKKCEAVIHARAAKMAVTANFVITRQNIHDAQKMIDLAAKLGVNRIECAHVQFHGWALENQQWLSNTGEALALLKEVISKSKQHYRGKMAIEWVNADVHQNRAKACMHGWGQAFMVIDPSGKALPCHLATIHKHLSFDNVREKSIKDIWEHSQAFNYYRDGQNLSSTCQNCPELEKDWGGCRCQALQYTQDAQAVDPACPRSKHHNEYKQPCAPIESTTQVKWRRPNRRIALKVND